MEARLHAESPRKPRKHSEIALRESRASKGGWRSTDRRWNLLFTDLDGSNTLGLSLHIAYFLVLSHSQHTSLSHLHRFSITLGAWLSKHSKKRCMSTKYGQRNSLPGDNKWQLDTSSHDLLQPSQVACRQGLPLRTADREPCAGRGQGDLTRQGDCRFSSNPVALGLGYRTRGSSCLVSDYLPHFPAPFSSVCFPVL